MADLVAFLVLVGVITAAGIGVGMLAARRLGAWDERRASADAAARSVGMPRPGLESAGDVEEGEPLDHGGEDLD